MPTNAEVGKVQVGVTHMTPLQLCYELNQDEKYEKGEEENKEA